MVYLEELEISLTDVNITPESIYEILKNTAKLKNLRQFAFGVSNCDNVKQECLLKILDQVAVFPNLRVFLLYACGIKCHSQALTSAFESFLITSQQIKRLLASLVSSIREKNGDELEQYLKQKFSRVEIKIIS